MESTEQLRNATHAFLAAPDQLTAVIASVAPDQTPHTAVVYYYIDHDFNLYFLTADGTQKHQNLCAHPPAAFTIGFGPEHTTVQGSGLAILLEKGSHAEKNAIAHINERLVAHDASWPAFQLEEHEDDPIAVFKISTDSLHVLNLEPAKQLPLTTKSLQRVI